MDFVWAGHEASNHVYRLILDELQNSRKGPNTRRRDSAAELNDAVEAESLPVTHDSRDSVHVQVEVEV
jgi:hypothetical protein